VVATLLSETVGGPIRRTIRFAGQTRIRTPYGFPMGQTEPRTGNPSTAGGQVIGIVLWDSDATFAIGMTTFLKTPAYHVYLD